MKCDELQSYKGDVTIPVYGTIADADVYLKDKVDAALSEKNKEIAKLKDKCQMHDFFWEGCGFAKRGFKNTIAVSEAFDKLEAENAELKQKLEDYRYTIAVLRKEKSHHKYKRCLAMAGRCRLRGRLFGACGLYEKELWALKWHRRWLELADKFKETK